LQVVGLHIVYAAGSLVACYLLQGFGYVPIIKYFFQHTTKKKWFVPGVVLIGRVAQLNSSCMGSASGFPSIQEFSYAVRLFSLRYRLLNFFAILTFGPSVVRETSIPSDGS
jgi:hypothetical protein